jgi:hypothetical protein
MLAGAKCHGYTQEATPLFRAMLCDFFGKIEIYRIYFSFIENN